MSMATIADRPRTMRRVFAAPRTLAVRVQIAGAVILGLMIAAAVLAPVLAPYGSNDLVCQPFQEPGAGHPLGCDDVGHDLWTKLLYGGQVSLAVGIAVAALSTLIATAVALIAGYSGGVTDRVAMRVVDVVMALPFLPLVIVLGVFFGASLATTVVVISLVMWAQPLRELRSQVLSIRASGFVEASATMGAGPVAVCVRHILPVLAPLIVPQFVRVAHNAILVESSLAFLGLGDPAQDSWGTILYYANARAAFLTGSWTYWILPPGLAIALAVVAFAFIGFGFGTGALPFRRRKRTRPPRASGAQAAVAAPAPGLGIEDLTVSYDTAGAPVSAVRGASLQVEEGEVLGLVGESGSGKSTLAMALLALLSPAAHVDRGRVAFDGLDLLRLPPAGLNSLRGKRIALVPQSAMNVLNPVRSIGDQLVETLRLHSRIPRAAARARAAGLMTLVGLPAERMRAYPHELSGGMRQRVVIAIALANDPEVIVADEPTTGLDVLVQAGIVRLLADLQNKRRLSVLFVTHNLPLATRLAGRLAVMYRGEIVDQGTPAALQAGARHAHTRALFASMASLDQPKRWSRPVADGAPVLELDGVSKTYRTTGLTGLFGPPGVKAVCDVSLGLAPGEVVGLVGGSGSGKTTIARLVTGRLRADAGEVRFRGRPVDGLRGRERQALRTSVHMVFQDPYQSIRNGMRIRDIVAEPLVIAGLKDRKEITRRVVSALTEVALPADAEFLGRMPSALSGGQRQRVALARAIITDPAVILADEPTSMLDQSIRMEIVALMERLRAERNTAVLFITHDMVLARHFCDRLIVLQDGRVVEAGPADEVTLHPRHPYTRSLIAAVESNFEMENERPGTATIIRTDAACVPAG